MFYDPYKQATQSQAIKKNAVAFYSSLTGRSTPKIHNNRTINNNIPSNCINCTWQSKLEGFLQSYWWLIVIAIIVILIIYFEVIK